MEHDVPYNEGPAMLPTSSRVVLSAPTAFSESTTFHQCHRLVAFGETLSVQTAAHDADSWEIGLRFKSSSVSSSGLLDDSDGACFLGSCDY